MPAIHVVSKHDNTVHQIVEYETPEPLALPASSVRVRTVCMTFSANNLSYARGGFRFNWWDAYPVPSGLTSPYNDREKWGIVPAWGRAEVLESNIEGLTPGDLLWGLHSTSSEDRIIQLEAMEPRRVTWKESSQQRSKLMDFYNTYRLDSLGAFPGVNPELVLGGRTGPEGSWLLYNYTFPSDVGNRLHPSGTDAAWSVEDADLSNSVIISLSAAGKTARAFAWCTRQSRERNIPLAMVQVTTDPHNLRPMNDDPFPVLNVKYTAVLDDETFDWIKQVNPERVVLLDFGASDQILTGVYEKAQSVGLKVMVVGIGSEAKVYTADESANWMETFQKVSKQQLNTGALRVAAIAQEKVAKTYFEKLDYTTNKLLTEEGFGKLTFDRRAGVDGINSTWEDLCNGKASPTSYINVYL